MNCNVFVYGTLKNKSYQKAIAGKSFQNVKGFLLDYARYTPTNGFPYIFYKPGKKVFGYVLIDVDEEALRKFDEYEDNGILYNRKTVNIIINKNESIEAYVYIANIDNLRRNYGDKLDYKILHSVEKHFEKTIGNRINLNNTDSQLNDSELLHRANLEIHAPQISHLINTFYYQEYFTNYEIDKELEYYIEPNLDDLSKEHPEYIYNYVFLLLKFTILNQLENKIKLKYARETFVKYPFWAMSKSILAALKLYNENSTYINILIKQYLQDFSIKNFSYKDIIVKGLKLSDKIFLEHRVHLFYIIKEIEFYDRVKGVLPLGVELEFSGLGREAVFETPKVEDIYNNFKYFYKFDFLRKLWKLGGHIDDHKISKQSEKNGGFLEFALGKNCLGTDESLPTTNNPKILNELIIEVCKFIKIKTHSLHLNMQVDEKKINWEKGNDPDDIKCLIIIGGDWHRRKNHFFENRFRFNELEDAWGNLHFSTLNYHSYYSLDDEEDKKAVVEYQFPRLKEHKDFELLIMTLKGYHLSGEHCPFMLKSSEYKKDSYRKELLEIKKWALNAIPLEEEKIKSFVYKVERGLMTEYHGKPVHKIENIKKTIFELEKTLMTVNEYVKLSGTSL